MKQPTIKEMYVPYKKKHNLPEFSVLDKYFEIGKIDKTSDFILRDIRKHMMEKIIGYIRFVEMMINPSQAPPMFMIFLKNIDSDDKIIIDKIYSKFVELELAHLRLEIEYSEENEAKIISNILDTWKTSTSDLHHTIGILEKNWKTGYKKSNKSYFG